jgi:glycosyltransferase involved in cell wall biosynthesis
VAKILLHAAAAWCPTGYGQQIAQLALRLHAAGHEVEMSAHYGLEGAPLYWNGIRVWPGANDFGDRMLPRYIKTLEPDLVLTLQDVWTLNGKKLRGAPLASWTPVDHEPLGAPIEKFFRDSGSIPVAMSRHGHRQLLDAGLDALYAPHAIDTNVFRPGDRGEWRDLSRIPESAFVILMVAANMDTGPSRKGYVEALRAFKIFRERHDDALLYLHTDLAGRHGGGVGLNIPWLCDRIGIDSDWLRGTPALRYELGLQPEQLALLYSSADVLLSPSYGEGFGIPVVEAQACGVPVIVSDFSSQPELCGAGWLVDGEPEWIDRYRAWWQRPNVESIVDALEHAYSEAAGLADRAVEFAAGYDADRVFNERWMPVLERLLPGQPNRVARRSAAREKAVA